MAPTRSSATLHRALANCFDQKFRRSVEATLSGIVLKDRPFTRFMFLFCACTQSHSNHKSELAALRLEASERRARYLRILGQPADIRTELI